MAKGSPSTPPRHFYLHIPFCARRCFYCDFAVKPGRIVPEDEWIQAISTELALLAHERQWTEPIPVDTVYVGGGTPSMLSLDAFGATLRALREVAAIGDAAEITVEANPESLTPELADGWRALGVNRVSIGVQSFHEPTLRWMGRLHGPRGSVEAVRNARNAGFRSVNVDLIFGVPRRLERPWEADLQAMLALEPDHISLYGLTAESGAPLGRRVEAGAERLAGEDRYTAEYLSAHDALRAAGLDHYEVSNFARPGHRSIHNQAYWSGRPYASVGPGAHAFYPPLRRWNERDWDAYRTRLAAAELPIEDEEEVSAGSAALERLWLGLRTMRGVALGDVPAPEAIDRLVAAGWASRDGDRLRLTPEGWIRMDAIVVELASGGPAR